MYQSTVSLAYLALRSTCRATGSLGPLDEDQPKQQAKEMFMMGPEIVLKMIMSISIAVLLKLIAYRDLLTHCKY